MSTDDPRVLRREIERTQHNLSTDVDALTEKVTPSRIMQRRVNRFRGRLSAMRDKVMGTASATASTVGDATGQATSTMSGAVSEAPQAIRRGTEGNPLAAGLIAFGLGWLAASLVPATRAEQQMGSQAKDFVREHTSEVGQVATQVKDNLAEPAQQAAEAVKSTAEDAAETVKDQTQSAAGAVTDHARDAKDTVRQQSSS